MSSETAPSKRSGTSHCTPPETLVPPPYGTTATFASAAHSSTASTSRSPRGRATTSGGKSKRPAKPRTTSAYDAPHACDAREYVSAAQISASAGGACTRAAGQHDVVERDRLADLAVAGDPQVLLEPRRGGAQLRDRPRVVLVAPAPVLAPAHVARG